jgi:tyrosyl-tRNA synthetase
MYECVHACMYVYVVYLNSFMYIDGQHAGDDMPASQILYPCMQAADIFFLGRDVV